MATGNLAIDHLRLDEAFASSTHRPFNECWTVRMDTELMIVDDEVSKASQFSDNEEDSCKALLIINDNNKQIVLLSIDNKLIANRKGGITDCAVFDDQQFRFVEFKTNALGNSKEAIRDTFDKAVTQLKETYQVFVDRLEKVDISFKDAVCIKCHIVISHSFPRVKATKQEYQLAFVDDTGFELSFQERTTWDI